MCAPGFGSPPATFMQKFPYPTMPLPEYANRCLVSEVLQALSTGTSPTAPVPVRADRHRPVLTDLIWSNRSDVFGSPSRKVHFCALEPLQFWIVMPVPAPLPAVTHMFPMPRHSTP